MTDLREWLDERNPEAGGLERLERALDTPAAPPRWRAPVATAAVAVLAVTTLMIWNRPSETRRLEAALREVLMPEAPTTVHVEGHHVTEYIDARNDVRVVVVEPVGGEERDRG